MRVSGILLLSVLFCILGRAQSPNTTKISGKVIDGVTQKPVEYATITITDKQLKTLTGTATDAKGQYEITGLPQGVYTLLVDFIGYKRYQLDTLRIPDNKKNIFVKTIQLTALGETLASVTVTSKAPVVENKIDKIIDVQRRGRVNFEEFRDFWQLFIEFYSQVLNLTVPPLDDVNLKYLFGKITQGAFEFDFGMFLEAKAIDPVLFDLLE